MLRAMKIRLLPTPEQEVLFWKSAGVARWAFNYYLAQQFSNSEIIKEGIVRKQITQLKHTSRVWLQEVGSNVVKQAVKDADIAFRRYLSKVGGKPHFKSRKTTTPSFYVNYESLRRVGNGFQGERLGYVKATRALPKLKDGEHYSNPRITYDGKHWYLSVGYEVEPAQVSLTGISLGVDLGIKVLAYCSDGKVYKNINKTHRVRQLERKLNRQQRSLDRMLLANTSGYKTVGKNRYPIYIRPLKECRNIAKVTAEIRRIHRTLANIRLNHIHQVTTEIVKTKPSRVVLEDLNVKGIMKNKHLAKAVQEQGFAEFRRQMKYKCEYYGIEFVLADRFYPSSKTCSNCGLIKDTLKLSDRVYCCECCGITLDRDFNASLNLAQYKSA